MLISFTSRVSAAPALVRLLRGILRSIRSLFLIFEVNSAIPSLSRVEPADDADTERRIEGEDEAALLLLGRPAAGVVGSFAPVDW